MIFPRLSPSAASWVAEGLEHGDLHVIVVDGRTIATGGIQPCWLTNDHIVYSSTSSASLICVNLDGLHQWTAPLPAPCNHLQAQSNHYLAWMPTYQGYMLDGREQHSSIRPALTPDGRAWYPPDGHLEPRYTSWGVSTIDHTVRPPRISPQTWAPWNPVTHWAVPVWTPEGSFILRLEDDRLVIHPGESPLGYIVMGGITNWPDAAWDPARAMIRVVWSDRAGVIVSQYIALDLPRRDLREHQWPPIPDPGPPPDPPDPPEPPMPDYPPFSWSRASIPGHSYDGIAAWPITSAFVPAVTITGQTDDTVYCDHSQAQVWPEIQTSTWGDINASIWAALPMPDGSWRVGTFDQLRVAQHTKGMEPFYGKPYALAFDADYQVRVGDPIGYMVSCPARDKVFSPVRERSSLVIIRYGTDEVLWREDAVVVPPPVDPPVDPPADDLDALRADVNALKAWARTVSVSPFRG